MPSGSQPSKLIVADGEPARAEAVASFLGSHGFETQALSDGSEAILAAETWPADAAVLSIRLANVSGIDVARHLRQSFGPTFRLVACSPATDSTSLRNLTTAGFDQVVATQDPKSILAALGDATRVLVARSMEQTVRRIELFVVLAHSLLGPRFEQATGDKLEKALRILHLVERDITRVDMPRKQRERLMREIGALAERLPDDRVTRF